ncbi:MAG: peptide-methionine (R)-S-oxide reductase [Pseudomonadota bacterium]
MTPTPDQPTMSAADTPTRRHFLATAAAAPLAIGAATKGAAKSSPALETDPFEYEIQRTEAEWRDLLTDEEYTVLRDGFTELPKTSDLWNDLREGKFACRGCGLHVYSSNWRVPLDKGWVFFAHAEPATVMTGIDGPQQAYGMPSDFPNLIEAHCRRCSSHLGHILIVDRQLVHCINGTSLSFSPSEA